MRLKRMAREAPSYLTVVRFGVAEVCAVILINLLPHREVARKRRKDHFNLGLVFRLWWVDCWPAGLYLGFRPKFLFSRTPIGFWKQRSTKFEAQIKDIAGLEAEIAALLASQQAVEDFQSDRNLPVHLLTELVHQLARWCLHHAMVQVDQNGALLGMAQSNERVSELLRNLANDTPWFTSPELVEIVAGTANLTPRDVRRVANFQIRVKLIRPRSPAKKPFSQLVAQKSSMPAAVAVVAVKGGHDGKKLKNKIDFRKQIESVARQFRNLEAKTRRAGRRCPAFPYFWFGGGLCGCPVVCLAE